MKKIFVFILFFAIASYSTSKSVSDSIDIFKTDSVKTTIDDENLIAAADSGCFLKVKFIFFNGETITRYGTFLFKNKNTKQYMLVTENELTVIEITQIAGMSYKQISFSTLNKQLERLQALEEHKYDM